MASFTLYLVLSPLMTFNPQTDIWIIAAVAQKLYPSKNLTIVEHGVEWFSVPS